MAQKKKISAAILLQVLGEAINCGIHAIDAQGYTIFYNSYAAEIDGLNQDEVLDKHILASFPSLTEETSTLLQVLQKGAPIKEVEQHFTNFKGIRISTVNTTVPIYSGKTIMGALEVSSNVRQTELLADKIIQLEGNIRSLKKSSQNKSRSTEYLLQDFIGNDPAIVELKERGLRAAQGSSPLLVYGETGTGKEILVQAIHNASPRGKKPFIAQNCAALPEGLLESLLFGTSQGAFTGAKDRAGLFELADEGSLFLDELDNLNLGLQAKLLRVLQEKKVWRLGDRVLRPIDVRIIASMNTDPLEAVEEGRLRKDLFYRINVVHLEIPPLRKRKGDILLLIDYFLQKHGAQKGGQLKITPEVKEMFLHYPWPGNARELEHAIEGALEMAKNQTISVDLLPPQILRHFGYYEMENRTYNYRSSAFPQPAGGSKEKKEIVATALEENQKIDSSLPFTSKMKQMERDAICSALKTTRGNVSRAARLLGIPRQTLQYKLKVLKINITRQS